MISCIHNMHVGYIPSWDSSTDACNQGQIHGTRIVYMFALPKTSGKEQSSRRGNIGMRVRIYWKIDFEHNKYAISNCY